MIDKNIAEYTVVETIVTHVPGSLRAGGPGTYTVEQTIEEGVNALIEQGWQPYGSPYVGQDGYPSQAMVRYGPPPIKRPRAEVIRRGKR